MSQTKIYVGNLSYDINSQDLESHFGQYGEVTDAKVITDRETGRSKGFGFVTFSSPEAMQGALEHDGKEWEGRPLRVNEANDKPRTGGGRGGNGGGGRW